MVYIENCANQHHFSEHIAAAVAAVAAAVALVAVVAAVLVAVAAVAVAAVAVAAVAVEVEAVYFCVFLICRLVDLDDRTHVDSVSCLCLNPSHGRHSISSNRIGRLLFRLNHPIQRVVVFCSLRNRDILRRKDF